MWDTGLPLASQKNETEVRKHIENLDRELDLVMIMEHFEESLLLFKRLACLRLKDIIFLPTNSRRIYRIHNLTNQVRE